MTELTLGQRIAAKRSELGLSQSALGEQLGVSRQSVFKWESDAAIPEIDKLISLSRLFGVSLDWLLGIGGAPGPKSESEPAEEPLQDFTDRERQILEQFANRKPVVPQWLKGLSIIAVSCAAVALINSCISLYQSSRAEARAKALQAQAEEFAAYVQSQVLPQEDVVKDYSYECIPALSLDKAEVRLRIAPHFYHPDSSASVQVLLGEEVMVLSGCRWNGEFWVTEFDLDPANGYQFLFRLTDETGTEFTQALNGSVMENLAYNLAWPTNYSVTWKDLDVQPGGFTFTDMTVEIPLPGVFRDAEGLWEQCDLVLTDDSGNELNRVDLMNRSSYSAQIDFSGSDVSFTTRYLEMFFPEQDAGRILHLQLECSLTTGHIFFCPVEDWKMTDSGLTTAFREARD